MKSAGITPQTQTAVAPLIPQVARPSGSDFYKKNLKRKKVWREKDEVCCVDLLVTHGEHTPASIHTDVNLMVIG